jgi:hypothetical protein
MRNCARTTSETMPPRGESVSAMAAAIALTVALSSGCGVRSERSSSAEMAAPEPPAPVAVETAVDSAEASSSPGGDSVRVEPQVLPGHTEGCAPGMVRVEGEYCPAVFQECLEHHPEWEKHQGEPGVAERCLKYAEPSRCAVKKRVHMSFCMDRYEYPNVPGELPRVLTSWEEAQNMCSAQGKRLCSEPEFNFACEGPEMLPYAYGYDRNANICNQDRDYRFPDLEHRMLHYEACLGDPACAAELERLDQRERIGERTTCASWAGVFDLNGNVNEWVVRPGEKTPERSGLKGGWWGPIRSRCRPTTTFHKEDDYGYEVGFRCCAEATR